MNTLLVCQNRSLSRWKTGIVAAALVGVMLVGVGCQSNGSNRTADNGDRTASETEPALAPQPQPLIADLPVPLEFELIDDLSRSFEAEEVRFVDHTYQGRATRTQLERFYREQLPERGWRFRNAQLARGTHVLRYDKAGATLEVKIADDERLFRGAYRRVTLLLQAPNQAENFRY